MVKIRGKNVNILLGFTFILIGFVLIVNSLRSITGYVIIEQIGKITSSILGIVFVLIGILLFYSSIEDKFESDKEYQKLKSRMKKLEVQSYGTEGQPESIRDAVSYGVPINEAIRIYEDSNKKVENGEWVVLGKSKYVSSRDPRWKKGTSFARFWGPSEYKNATLSKLERLYHEGKLGKTHEVVIGSDDYIEKEGIYHGKVSKPPIGSTVYHRHWEIEQMYRHGSKNRSKEESK